jgi:hypothetical protein
MRDSRGLAGCAACRCAAQWARLKSDGYTCRTARRRLVDAGSNPASSTNTQSPTRLSWGFFSSLGAYCPVLLRVPAESCGPRPPHDLACSAPSSLSFGHFSQRLLRTGTARSPQDPRFGGNKINNLQVDELSGLIPALAGARKSQPCSFWCEALGKAGSGQKRSLTCSVRYPLNKLRCRTPWPTCALHWRWRPNEIKICLCDRL